MSFNTFMKDLIGSACNENISIVTDNAVLPSLAVLSCSRKASDQRTRMIVSSMPSMRRKVNRYHSEPIKYDTFLQAPKVTSRWDCSVAEARKDKVIDAPKRAESRWSVQRIHSDSDLITPTRTTGMPVCHSVLSSSNQRMTSTPESRVERRKPNGRMQKLSPPSEADESDVCNGTADASTTEEHHDSSQDDRTDQEPNKRTTSLTSEESKREETENITIQVVSAASFDMVFFSVGCLLQTVETEVVRPSLFDFAHQLLNIISVYIQLYDHGNKTSDPYFPPFSLKTKNHGLSAVARPS